MAELTMIHIIINILFILLQQYHPTLEGLQIDNSVTTPELLTVNVLMSVW